MEEMEGGQGPSKDGSACPPQRFTTTTTTSTTFVPLYMSPRVDIPSQSPHFVSSTGKLQSHKNFACLRGGTRATVSPTLGPRVVLVCSCTMV